VAEIFSTQAKENQGALSLESAVVSALHSAFLFFFQKHKGLVVDFRVGCCNETDMMNHRHTFIAHPDERVV
jgi:hypothetical protein